MGRTMSKFDGGQCVRHSLLSLGCSDVSVDQRQFYVLKGGAAAQEIEVLEYEPNLAASDACTRIGAEPANVLVLKEVTPTCGPVEKTDEDRKSTRLNSSHLGISYAVFCLKKKKTK